MSVPALRDGRKRPRVECRRGLRLAIVASLGALLLSAATAAEALAVPDATPGSVGAQAFTRATVEFFGVGGGDPVFWTQTVAGANGIAASSYDSPLPIATDPSAVCPGDEACAGWVGAARGRTNVAAGRLGVLGDARMWIGHSNGAGLVFVDGAALIDDTITLPEPATVTLTGRLSGAMRAFNNDYDNQGNDPRASLEAYLAFTRDREGPCEDEWCPPREELGGYSETVEPTVTHGATGPIQEVDEEFSVEVPLPAGTTAFTASLVSSLDYQVFGYSDRLVDKRARLDFDDTLEFEIAVPEEIADDTTSGSGLLPIGTGAEPPDPAEEARAHAVDLRAEGATCTQIATVMRDEHARNAGQTAAILRHVGCSAVEAGSALEDVYEVGAQGGGEALKHAGYGAVQIAEALERVFAKTAAQSAALLKGLGFGAAEVADALKRVFAKTAAQSGALLKGLGFGATEGAEALKRVFARTAAQSAALLKNLGFDATEVAEALKRVFAKTAAQSASALKGLGFGVNQVANALKRAYGLGVNSAAAALRVAGFTAKQVASAVRQLYGAGAKPAAAALKDAGYGATAVAAALKSVWSIGWQKAYTFLRAAGFGIGAAKSAVCAVFGKQC